MERDFRKLYSALKPYFTQVCRDELHKLSGDELLAAMSPEIKIGLRDLHGFELACYADANSTDYLVMDFIDIDFAQFVTPYHLLIQQRVFSFTDDSDGYSVSPTMYSQTQLQVDCDPMVADYQIEYGFGVKNCDGKLLYPCPGPYYGQEYSCPTTAGAWAIHKKLHLSQSANLLEWRAEKQAYKNGG